MAADPKPKYQPVPENIFLVVGPNLLPIEFPTTNIGRHVNNNIIVNDPLVSRYHARILYRDNKFFVEDLESTHGTKVNGERIKIKEIVNGDTLSIASTPILFIDRSRSLVTETERDTKPLEEEEA
jgi:pSer/pThr/pTyr-binding forkhead associated (FHA) protein